MDPVTAYLAGRATAAVRRRVWPVVVVVGVAGAALLVPFAGLPGAAPPVPPAPAQQAAVGCAPPGAPAGATRPAVGGVVDRVEVARVAYQAGWRGEDVAVAVAVAEAESSLRADVVNPAAGGNYGLWQINTVHQALLAKGDWRDPAANAGMAYQVWADDQSWEPWEAYTTGAHARFLPQAREAVAGLGGPAVAPAVCVAVATAAADGSITDPGDGGQDASGLRPRAAAAKATAFQLWGCEARQDPCVASIGGYARRNIAGTGKPSDHSTGQATDIMIPNYQSAGARALGKEIADYFVANTDGFGVKYVIYYEQIWTPSRGWRPYRHPSGSNDDTLQHRDHVHVSVN